MKRLFRPVIWGAILLTVIVVVLQVFSAKFRGNFSQFPGFSAYFASNPPASEVPSENDQKLLQRYRPRFFVSAASGAPISFYDDYIAQGELYGGDGKLISAKVTRDLLNTYKDKPKVLFRHVPPQASHKSRPVIFARIERAEVDLGEGAQTMAFLSYHAVFRSSGLPAGMRTWQALPLSFIADLEDWHQLDHYTAATIVLDSNNNPVALLLQQHNYHRTYLYGEGTVMPPDGRSLIDVAERSNELYPHAQGRQRRRAASFIDEASWQYLIGATSWRLFAGDDITDPAQDVEYALEFLPPDDAFYTFKGHLGERRLLPGRDGPPGANYKTLPQFLPARMQLLLGYWREGNRNDIRTLHRAFTEKNSYHAFTNSQTGVLKANMACLKRWKTACALQ